MGIHENKYSWKVPDGVPRRLPPRLLVLAGLMGSALVLLLAFSFGTWPFRGRHSEDLGNRFPPGTLADYVPEDSAAVLAVNFRQLLESSIGRLHARKSLQQLIVRLQKQLPWLEPTRIEPIDDVDTLFISFPSAGGGEPLLMAGGRFDPSRFQIGPGMLEEQSLDHFRIWEYHERPAKEITSLALVGDMLAVSRSRLRVQAALKQASHPQPICGGDAKVRELLTKVDRRQTLWLAASVKELSPVSGIENYLLRMILRPLLAGAESVYGGLTCTNDIRADLSFSTVTDDNAVQLEKDLASICEAAPGAALLDQQNELRLLLRLLAAGEVRREGKSVLLHCRLTAEQLDK